MSSLGLGNHATSQAAIWNALGAANWKLFVQETRMRRYESRSTIMTSDQPLKDWCKLRSDVPIAGAVLDRFQHHAITAAINGRSDRVKDFRPHGQKTSSLASQPKLQHQGGANWGSQLALNSSYHTAKALDDLFGKPKVK